MKRLALLRAHRKELLRRESILRPAFKAHHHIQPIAGISAGDLLPIQYRQLVRKILPGQFKAEIRRKL
jgi:hypothetical protein